MLEHGFERGLLLYHGPSLAESGQLTDRILRGAQPGDIPMELPTRCEPALNLKTACMLGLTIPQSLLLRADEVIE